MTKIDFRSLANRNIRQLTPFHPGKLTEKWEREFGVFSPIKLSNNENPLGPSLKAISAATEALYHAHYYPDGHCYDLKQVLSNRLSINPEQLTIGNGSENILELIIKAYLSKDSNAIISQYVFLTIPMLLHSYDIPTNVIPAHEWGHDIAGMVQAVDEKTRVLFLVNPNNPTGTYIQEKDFLALMDALPPHVLVVVDEAYVEYVKEKDYPNTLKYLSIYPNLLITRTFSKAYGLAGLRLGYAVSSSEIADILNRARLPFNINIIAVKAACAAINDLSHIQKTVEVTYNGRQQLEKGLQKLQLTYIPSITNFVTIDVVDSVVIYQQLLYEGIIVMPLQAYAMPRHIRVTIGTFSQNAQFLSAIELVINKLKKE